MAALERSSAAWPVVSAKAAAKASSPATRMPPLTAPASARRPRGNLGQRQAQMTGIGQSAAARVPCALLSLPPGGALRCGRVQPDRSPLRRWRGFAGRTEAGSATARAGRDLRRVHLKDAQLAIRRRVADSSRSGLPRSAGGPCAMPPTGAETRSGSPQRHGGPAGSSNTGAGGRRSLRPARAPRRRSAGRGGWRGRGLRCRERVRVGVEVAAWLLLVEADGQRRVRGSRFKVREARFAGRMVGTAAMVRGVAGSFDGLRTAPVALVWLSLRASLRMTLRVLCGDLRLRSARG